MPMRWLLTLILLLPVVCLAADDAAKKPCVAVFPLSGDAAQDLRDRAGFSLRIKLDRTGDFDVIDGPKMNDTVAELQLKPTLATTPAQLEEARKLRETDSPAPRSGDSAP